MTAEGMANSLFSVVALSDGKTIGCGRIIGDGGLYFNIQDVIVLPEYKDMGIGRKVMEELFAYLISHTKSGAFIGLFAAGSTVGFYKQFGFQ